MNQTARILLHLSYSVIASIFVILLVFLFPGHTATVLFLDKLVITGIFGLCCILGISFVLYPGWFKKKVLPTPPSIPKQQKQTEVQFKGHHPNCTLFRFHTFSFKNNVCCAGCMGLAMGACVSLFLILLYHFDAWSISFTKSGVVISIFLIFLFYALLLLSKRKNIIHSLVNLVFIVNFLFLTISMLELTKNTLYAILTILFCFLWLDTRIQLSNWQHKRICRTCPKSCKMY